jgi:hypothetical protein
MLACGQQKTLNYYTKASWDSLLLIKNQTQSALTSANAVVTARNATIVTLNTTVASRDQQVLTLTNLYAKTQTKADSLLSANENLKSIIQEWIYPNDTLKYINDTITVELISDSVSVSIAKIGTRFNYQVVDKNNRINFWYIDGKWEQWFMIDSASWQHFNGKLK